MELHSAQREIVTCKKRFRVLCAGRRFGKTVLAVEEMIFTALTNKDARVAYLAPTFQAARDIAWSQLKQRVQVLNPTINDSRLEVEIGNKHGGKSKILLRSWENVETLRGQYFDFLILDEVAQYRGFWENWHEVLRPALTDRKGKALFISTPLGFNAFYDLFNLQHKDEDYKSFHFTSYDNPFLPKEEIDKARLELTEDRFAQEYGADFRKTEGLVYKEFERKKHIYTEEPQTNFIETIAGVDFGTTNPCAVLTIKRDYDNHFWVTDEWYFKGKTETEIVEYVSASNFNKVYPDPESASGVQEMRKRGVNVRDVIKGKDSIRNGINKVRELFKSGRLHIHVSCSNLIWELETYSYPEKKSFKNEEENPIKENDHAVDALRYPLMMITDSIQNIQRRSEPVSMPLYHHKPLYKV